MDQNEQHKYMYELATILTVFNLCNDIGNLQCDIDSMYGVILFLNWMEYLSTHVTYNEYTNGSWQHYSKFQHRS